VRANLSPEVGHEFDDCRRIFERRKVPPFGVYTLVRFRRCEPQSAAA